MEKPRLCEILGVEVGEEFKIKSQKYEHSDRFFQVMPGGRLTTNYVGESSFESLMGRSVICLIALCEMIEHPELIIHLSKPLTYTEQEIAIMRGRVAEGINWITRDSDGSLRTFANKPQAKKGDWNDVCGCPYQIRNINLFPQITFENSPINMKEELMRIDESNKNPPPAQTGEGK